MAMALSAFASEEADYSLSSSGRGREKLGYLPGDMLKKVNPYLRPLYDALFDLVGPGKRRDSSVETL